MKTLVLAEKPSVGRELARILGCKEKAPGALIGSEYVVTWALGHLVTLATPEEYNKEWSQWKLETLPMIPTRFDTTVIPQTQKQYGIVRNWLKNPQISKLIIATDAGREGELVARWIINKVGFSKPMERLWISSMTDQAIKNGFKMLKPARHYDNLYRSAEARSIADWLIGLNVTRALTCKYNAQLSAGRVQTPTLAMIVERENEIRQFKPKTFYQVIMHNQGVRFTYQLNKQTRIFEKAAADKIMESVKGKRAVVSSVVSTQHEEQPPLLYDLTELQRDANRLYGFGAKKTLDIAQRLYEQAKVLTYPRTDSRYLTTDMVNTMMDRIKNLGFDVFSNTVRQLINRPLKNSKRIFDNQKVSDHHAIIPTEQKPNLMVLSSDERLIYNLVVKRFLSVFLDASKYLQTTIAVTVNNHMFEARGKIIVSPGWRVLYDKEFDDEEEADAQLLPAMKVNDQLVNPRYELKVGTTSPPARYTEATLLSSMEYPAKFVESKQLKEVLEKTSGIGTPATRAEIIERLFSVGYMELKGKTIHPTMKGEQLISIVPNELKSPQLTATWELRLMKISDGKEDYLRFVSDMEKNAKALVEEISKQEHRYQHDNATRAKCPNCGKGLLEIKNKQGEALACQDRSCGYRKNTIRYSQLRCPTCHKRLNIIGSDDKRFYQCGCGFKENCDSFHSKLNERKKDLNKKEVATYLKKQVQEIPIDNPFKDFFKK